MNKKARLFSFALAILFANALFVFFDELANVAKAGACSDCTTYCQQYGKSKTACKKDDCLVACTIVVPDGGTIIYDQEMCLEYFGFRYFPSADGTTCIKGSGSGVIDDEDSEDENNNDDIEDFVVSPIIPGQADIPNPGFVPGEIDWNIDDGDCNSDADCSLYNCCSGMADDVTREQIDENNANREEAQSASEAQEQAYYEYMAAKERFENCGSDKQACQEAKDAMSMALKAFVEATERVIGAVTRYNASNLVVFPELGKAGTGYLLCANGLLAQTCKDGSQGKPFLKGIPGADDEVAKTDKKGFFGIIFGWPNVVITFFILSVPVLFLVKSAQKNGKKPKKRR
ncbi:MAG: hypothetical protein ACD_8C00005G0006 [uncultured bacterium]|nr:MAG: hypothetical protein ACD_8C00005G0006 [uncultured bacterium]